MPAAGSREPWPGDREPAESGTGREDRRLPRGARLQSARSLPDDGHPQRAGQEDALGGIQPTETGGIIAIKLREDDELVDVVVTKPGDEVLLATASGMAIRFRESDARPMGRNTSGVKGITLQRGDELVGMVVADPGRDAADCLRERIRQADPVRRRDGRRGNGAGATDEDDAEGTAGGGDARRSRCEEESASATRYRTQHRGGKGLRDIKTTERNGRVIGITRVSDDDEVLMMTARGKIQRMAANEISVIGRNTQGVRIMTLDEEDVLAAIVRVPQEEVSDEDLAESLVGAGPPVDGVFQDPTPFAELLEEDADLSDEDDVSDEGADSSLE